jgi:plastocyanin domain-containing protein
MNKIALSIMTLGLIIGIGITFLGNSNDNTEVTASQAGQNVVIKDGVQYITIVAKGGYSPRTSSVQADIPTKLIVKTNGTYDCSAALVIRSVGYQKILPQTGEEIIDLGTLQKGAVVQGTCSMGMYSFTINVSEGSEV